MQFFFLQGTWLFYGKWRMSVETNSWADQEPEAFNSGRIVPLYKQDASMRIEIRQNLGALPILSFSPSSTI